MNGTHLSAQQIARLTEIADILLPATEKLPAPGKLAEYNELLNTAFAASGFTSAELRDALDVMPTQLDWNSVKQFCSSHPVAFEMLALLVSGAYAMTPEILNTLGFPTERRNPAGPLEAAEEYETGILEPVVSRGPFFRDPRL